MDYLVKESVDGLRPGRTAPAEAWRRRNTVDHPLSRRVESDNILAPPSISSPDRAFEPRWMSMVAPPSVRCQGWSC